MAELPDFMQGPATVGGGGGGKTWASKKLAVAAALIGGGMLSLFALVGEDAGKVSSAPAFDTETGLESIGPDPGGLAPGQSVGGYAKRESGGPADSLAMFRGANPSAEVADIAQAAVEAKKDYVDALKQVAKKKTTKKPRGIAAKLKSMAAKWGGSGGSSGASASSRLAAPSSAGFKLARRGGPGAAPRVADQEFRGTVTAGGGAVRNKKTGGVSGFIASAAQGVSSLFGGAPTRGFEPGAASGNAGPGALDALPDSEPSRNVDIPDPDEGKPVADGDGDAANDEKGNPLMEKALETGLNGVMSPIGDAFGKSLFGGGKDDAGGGGTANYPTQSDMERTVSGAGLAGDAEAQKALGDALVHGSGIEVMKSEPPSFTPASIQGNLQTGQTALGNIKPFVRGQVDTEISAAQNMQPAPTATITTTLISNDLDVSHLGNISEAKRLALEAETARAAALERVTSMRGTLVQEAKNLSLATDRMVQVSERSIELGREQTKLIERFNSTGRQIQEELPEYQAALARQDGSHVPVVERTDGHIAAYHADATQLQEASAFIANDISEGRATINSKMPQVQRTWGSLKSDNNTRLALYRTQINALKTKVNEAAASPFGREVGTPGAQFLSNGRTLVQEHEDAYTALSTANTEYQQRGDGIIRGMLYIQESFNPS